MTKDDRQNFRKTGTAF